MRILITGAGGFVGRHLVALVRHEQPDDEIHGVGISQRPDPDPGLTHYHLADLRDQTMLNDLIATLRPDTIYHLAATAAVGASFDAPWETIENNVRAQLNLFMACIHAKHAPRILVITSGEVYGVTEAPAQETTPFRPSTPYGVSKVTQDVLCVQYALSHKLPIICARPFNHTGPGQRTGFVAADFASQIAAIEAGTREPIMNVGDLTTERDFTDVRDVVRAYHLLMQHGIPGEAYNVCSGQPVRIRSLLDTLLSHSAVNVEVVVDRARVRPSGPERKWGDPSKLRALTGWQPKILLPQTLSDLLDDYRNQVRASAASERL